MNSKTTLGREWSISLTRKDPFSVLPSLFSSSTEIQLNSNWRQHEWLHSSYPTMSIHAHPVTWSAQIAACQQATWDFTPSDLCQPEPWLVPPPSFSSPSPSPVAYVQTGSISAPASFSSLLDSPSPPPLTVWVNITPYYPFFTATVFNTRSGTIALQIQTHTNWCWEHTHTLWESSSHINGNYMQAVSPATE